MENFSIKEQIIINITDIQPQFFRKLTEQENIFFEEWLKWKIINECYQNGFNDGSVWYLDLEEDFEVFYKVKLQNY